MVKTLPLGLKEALQLTLDRIEPLAIQRVALLDALDRTLAKDIVATVDSPSVDASMKDGYAVIASDVQTATREDPVRLKMVDSLSAGEDRRIQVAPGTAVRILTGARIPTGASAVVAEEYTESAGETITVFKHAEPGRNILPKSADVAAGQIVAAKGSMMTPGLVGLLAAAGHSHMDVVGRPRVAIIATGDEVVAPGKPLPEGKLYASNMTTLAGWCRQYGMDTDLDVVKDDYAAMSQTLGKQAEKADAIITSGGAWTGDRDLVAHVLEGLGWQQVFHRIRIGPGKAVGFGILKGKPVFILPGGPPSNLMGFFQIALPGILKLAGDRRMGLPEIQVRTATQLTGRDADWTQFIYGILEKKGDTPVFHALKNKSRLRSMAEAQAVVAIAEGQTIIPAGALVKAQALF